MGKYTFLLIVFLFIFGAVCGWCVEVLFRKFFSKNNPDHKWLNPGLLTGPWLPIYGFGTVFLFIVSAFSESLNLSPFWFNVVLFLTAACFMTLLELVGGLFLLKVMHLRLWDYRKIPGNFKGVICPRFFLIWGMASVGYYYFLNDLVVAVVVKYFAELDIFTFFVGIAWGLFIVDLWNALGVSNAIKKYAKENDMVIEFETVKQEAARQQRLARQAKREKFFMPTKKDEIVDFIKTNFPEGTEKAKQVIENVEEKIDKVQNEIEEVHQEIADDIKKKKTTVKKKVNKVKKEVKKEVKKATKKVTKEKAKTDKRSK